MASSPPARDRPGPGRLPHPVTQNGEMSAPVLKAETLVTTDGVPIDAIHLPGGRELAIVMAHGFTLSWSRPFVWKVAKRLNQSGGVVTFDFRGHGRSGGLSTMGDREINDLDVAVAYARERKPFGKPLAANQAIQFPLVELQTQCEMLRALIHKTAWLMDTQGPFSASDKVSMCNYWANRLCCEAADRAMQVHGGLGYSRHKPFEHIYRHHRRYRITEGSEEIQMRRVAGYMFGYMHQRAPKGVTAD